ncbi:MAG: OmpA family protein [Saprospiraceae bacterium]|nr:OmpA family protein [Saprospiraceae bacterium]MDW8483715.1 DUF6089 family protein [Saprospiraceae bacterium]
MRYLGILFKLLLGLMHLQGQTIWEIGAMGGFTAYAGDLNEHVYYDYKVREFAYGMLLRRHFGPTIAVRLNYLGGKIAGDESHFTEPSWRAERRFKFSSQFHEGSLLLEWDLFGYRRRNGWRFRRIFGPYAFVGAGFNYFRSRTDYNDEDRPNPNVSAERILADKQAAPPPPTPIIHFGGGFKWDIGRYWILSAELGMRRVFSDYLDGVSIAGIPDTDDWFAFAGIVLSHRIRYIDSDRDWIPNRRDKCPLSAGPRRYRGCPDADKDGIVDDYDECPFMAGVLSARGCPDLDGDGIQDSLDLCPSTPGFALACGCPDRDGDAIPDIEDQCPDLPGLHYLEGCPDADDDRIPDPDDACPHAPGKIRALGCPDADDDGVADLIDLCPDLSGEWRHLGCPDSDEDDLPNYEDLCPQQKGLLALHGCPDTDHDNIPDYADRCPTRSGDKVLQGCPDSDEDGLADPDDRCPFVAGTVAERGCPELKKHVIKQLKQASKQIQFETGSDKLTQASIQVVEQIANILYSYPNYRLIIEGHTDNRGKKKRNQELSERRAARCKEKLIELGIESERLHSVGFGQTKPIASNKTEKGRALNRRVELRLVRMD